MTEYDGGSLQKTKSESLSILIAVLILSVLLVAGCATKFEVGEQTQRSWSTDTDVDADEYRAVWVGHFNTANPGEQAKMIRRTIDTLCLDYLNYGYRVANHWHEANDQQPRNLPAEDMRKLVTDWTAPESKMFEGYEDALEYGMGELKRLHSVEGGTLELLQKHLDLYFEVYRTVFRPSGTAEEYERNLDLQRFELESVSQTVREDLRKYR